MAETRYQHTVDGQEVEEADLNLLAQGALMDDRLLADILRLAPNLGSVGRAIVPTGAGPYTHTLRSSGSANASVVVYPFRAVIGSRTAVSATPGSALDAWRDIRSSVYSVSDNNTTLGHTVGPFGANASGNARWDLVQVAVSVDATGALVNRYVKPAVSTAPTVSAIATTVVQSITVSIVPGTASASPALPAPSVDSAGIYYIPLAYVRIPNGFSGSSTILSTDLYDVAPVVPIARALGACSMVPATGNSVLSAAAIAAWGTSGTRPGHLIPATMVGSEGIFAAIDMTAGSSVNWSHSATNGLIDGSRDWRYRVFRWQAIFQPATGSPLFAWNVPSGNQVMPSGRIVYGAYGSTRRSGAGQSFSADETGGILASILSVSPGDFVDMNAASIIAIDVNMSTGQMLLNVTNAPVGRLFVWIDATAPYTNV
jgi:hypothetical protein